MACDRPDVLSRWMLEQTAELVAHDAELHGAVTSAIRDARPLHKPADHRGGSATDMFVVTLSPELTHRLQCEIAAAIRGGTCTTGTRARGLGGFAEAWREYADGPKPENASEKR